MSEVILSEINIFPVKSFAGISLSESVVEERGLRHDRRWMLIDADGNFMTQREYPQMARVKVTVGSDSLGLEMNGKPGLSVQFLPDTGEKVTVDVWSRGATAELFANEINSNLSDMLGVACRLVYMSDDDKRYVNKEYAVRPSGDIVSFADGYPVLLIGEGSLADLNSRLESPVPMNRFRPNLVVKNADTFAEDKWIKIKIGETIFHLVKPCDRCVMTTVEQSTGEFSGKEPLKTLASYRTVKSDSGNKVLFGQNLIAENFGEVIRVGDKVEILEVKK